MSIRSTSGFTLIELIIFIVIVSVGLAGVLLVFDTVTRRSADPVRAKQAIAVAEGMLDEILNKNFCDPDTANTATSPVTCGANTVEASRDLYDSIDDFNGYSRSGIRSVANDPTVVLAGYNITSISVARQAANLVTGDATGNNYSIVTVTVLDTLSNQSFALTGYKFNND